MKAMFRLILFLLIIQISAAVSAEELTNIKLRLKWSHNFQFAGYYAAIQNGYYKDEGLSVELLEGGPGIEPVDEVTSGRADIAIETPYALVRRSQGAPVRILTPIFQHSPAVFITLKDSGIKNPADMVGRRVAVSEKSLYILKSMLINEGIEPDDVDILVRYGKVHELLSGDIDATLVFISNEPHTLDAMGVEYTLIHPINYGIDYYGDCLISSESYISNNRQTVDRFLKASLKGWQYALNNIPQTAEMIIRKYGPGKIYDTLLNEAADIKGIVDNELVEIGHNNMNRWARIANDLVANGIIKGAVDLDKAIYNRTEPQGIVGSTRVFYSAVLITAFLIFFTIALIFFNRKLNITVHEKTNELTHVNKTLVQEIIERRKTEKIYRSLFESSSDAIFIVDEKTIIDCNSSAEKLLNMPKINIIGSDIVNFTNKNQLYGKSGSEFIDENLQKLRSGESVNTEFMFNHPSGKVLYTEINLSPLRELGRGTFQCAVRDLTGKKKAEEEVAQQRAKLQKFIDSAVFLAIEINEKSEITLANTKVLEITGYEHHELKGKIWYEVLIPDRLQNEMREMSYGVRAGTMKPLHTLELPIKTIDGSERIISWHISYETLPGQSIGSVYVTGLDITENLYNEEQLRQAQKMAATGEMLGAIAHQWRQPLNTLNVYITGIASAMDLDEFDRSMIKDAVGKAKAQIRFMSDTIEDFRNYMKPSKSEETFELNEIINKAADLLIPQLKHNNIELEMNYYQSSTIYVTGRKNEIMHVFLNLFNNAKDTILQKMAIDNTSDGKIMVSIDTDDGYAVITVEDSGLGVPEENLNKIFDPFFTTKGESVGTGIGLYMAKIIIEGDMDGSISASNSPEGGAVFTIKLPH